MAKGTVLNAAEIALIASVGISSVLVVRNPRVGVLSSGNELVEVESEVLDRGKGLIRDTNKLMLKSYL